MLIKKLYAQIYPPLYVNKHDSSKWAKILISRARRKDYDCDALTSLCCTYLKNESSSKSAKAPRNMATKGYSLTQKWLRSQLHLGLMNATLDKFYQITRFRACAHASRSWRGYTVFCFQFLANQPKYETEYWRALKTRTASVIESKEDRPVFGDLVLFLISII